MLSGKDVITIEFAILFKNCITNDQGYSPLSPLQGGLESTTGIVHLFVKGTSLRLINLSRWIESGSSRVRRTSSLVVPT